MIPEFLSLPDRRLAYQLCRGRSDRPGVIFLSGYMSDMTGTKAEYLAARCQAADFSYLRFDYHGTGQSDGDFLDGTIGSWFDDTCVVFETLTTGPQIVVGSSMGGWIGLMLARREPQRVKAFIGIAAAADFTEDLILPHMSAAQHAELLRAGVVHIEDPPGSRPMPLTRAMVADAREHLILRAPLDLACPVRLLQGMEDEDVPWQHAIRTADACVRTDVRVTLIKDGGHRLSRPEDLDLLWRTIEEFTC